LGPASGKPPASEASASANTSPLVWARPITGVMARKNARINPTTTKRVFGLAIFTAPDDHGSRDMTPVTYLRLRLAILAEARRVRTVLTPEQKDLDFA
jgi:hypothetical protein